MIGNINSEEGIEQSPLPNDNIVIEMNDINEIEDDISENFTGQLNDREILKKYFTKWITYRKRPKLINSKFVIGDNISSNEDSSECDTSNHDSEGSPEEIEMQHLELNQCTDNHSVEEIEAMGQRYKKLNYNAVEKEINRFYLDENHKFSAALDILASYLKGQKLFIWRQDIMLKTN